MYGGAALNAFHALHTVLAAVLPGPRRPPAGAAAGGDHPAVGGRARELEVAAGRRRRAGAGRRAAGRRARRRGVLHPHDGRAVAGRPPDRGRAGAHDRRAGRHRRPVGADRRRPALRGDRREPGGAAARRAARRRGADASAPTAPRPPRSTPTNPRCRPRGAPSSGRPACRAALCRSGGTLPILAAFAERGIPAIVSGFSLPDDALHAPNESYRLVALEQGAAAARALYEELAALAMS